MLGGGGRGWGRGPVVLLDSASDAAYKRSTKGAKDGSRPFAASACVSSTSRVAREQSAETRE